MEDEYGDDGARLREVFTLIQLRLWSEARIALQPLAIAAPRVTRLRALLAYVRGHEAETMGDLVRAHEEWRRALILDPWMQDAALSIRMRPRRRSAIERLLGLAR